jgi:hypothetical protein
MRAALATAVMLALAAPAHAEYTSVGPVPITPAEATIPRGGGVLVGCCELVAKDDLGLDPTVQPAWRFKAGAKLVKPVVKTLAPGLAVYGPVRGAGVQQLLDGEGATLGRYQAAASSVGPWKVAAPAIRSVDRIQYTSGQPDEWSIDATPPPEAVAVVLFVVEGKRRTAIDWHALREVKRAVAGRRAPGARDPEVGERVEVRWVDVYGRSSPPSKVVQVVYAMGCQLDEPACPGIDDLDDPEAVGGTSTVPLR